MAADERRALIGVRRGRRGDLEIWGLVNSGTRWLRDVRGGRRAGAPLPPSPVVRVDAPGSVEAYRGHELVAKLRGGRLSGSRLDPFESEWLPGQFSGLLEWLVERHEAARDRAFEFSGERWAPLEPTLPHRITRRMMQRVLSVLRDARHGGTVIFVPQENAGGASSETPYIDLRYPFADDRARLCFPDLVVDILNRLARIHGTTDPDREPRAVGWEEFEATTDHGIAALDEALFETAHLISGLAAADGAVIMGKNNELLGFGGMVSGRLPDVGSVWRALDLEGGRVAEEGTGDVGARHRSAYRLCAALPGAVAVVVSQDGAYAGCAGGTAASRTGSKSDTPLSFEGQRGKPGHSCPEVRLRPSRHEPSLSVSRRRSVPLHEGAAGDQGFRILLLPHALLRVSVPPGPRLWP